MSSNTTKTEQTPQTENGLGSTIVIFVVMLGLFLASVYSLSFLSLGNPWPMAACLALFAASFWIPQTILGRSDSAGEN
jgi:hypothetical protein